MQGDGRQGHPVTAYPVILPLLLSHLDQHRSVASLANLLHVRDYQAKDWLKQAISDRKVAKVNDRYVALKAL